MNDCSRRVQGPCLALLSASPSSGLSVDCLPMVFRSFHVDLNSATRDAPDEVPTLIVIELTGLNGTEFAKVKSYLGRHPSTPRLGIVGATRREGHVQAQALGVNNTVAATAGMEALVAEIQNLLGAPTTLKTGILAPEASSAAFDLVSQLFDQLPVFTSMGKPICLQLLKQTADSVLKALTEDGISAWLDIVNSHHSQTYRHSMLVTGYAAVFAERLGLPHEDRRLLVSGALVHDIGKSRIALAILEKPGPLTQDEYDEVKLHPAHGAEILSRNPHIDPLIVSLARHHHEYIDGSGYPDGLRGDQIHPMVRMLTICDIFTALVEERAYKESMSARQAFSILHSMRSKLDQAMMKEFGTLVLAPNIGHIRRRTVIPNTHNVSQ